MLNQAVTITASSTPNGSGSYSVTLGFVNSSQAVHLRVGDVLTDKNGNEYSVVTWTGNPADYSNFTAMTVSFITADIAPATFSSFGDASISTPGQEDVRPAVQSLGTINSAALFSGQNYEYDVTATWSDASAGDVQIGDCVMDTGGKKYEITQTNAGFTSGRVIEVEKEGKAPDSGNAVLFRPTPNYGLQQPLFLTNDSNLFGRNRDFYLIDKQIAAASGGAGGSGDFQLIPRTISSGEASAKKLVLNPDPLDTDEVAVFLIGGTSQKPGVDYEIINGNELSWDSKSLDGILTVGDMLLIMYFS